MSGMAPLRVVVFALYVPVLGAVVVPVWQCLFLLVRLQPAGLLAVPYGAALWLVGRRALRVLRDPGADPRPDLVLTLAADALIAVLLVSAV